MIYDFDTEVTASAPGDGISVTYSDSYSLTDGSDGVPQLFGGGQIYMQFEVTTAFAVGAGAPLAQFGIAIDDNATLTDSSLVLALTGGSVNTNIGLDAAQLTLGRTFHLAIPSWEDIMQLNGALWPDTKSAAAEAAFRLIRFMGIVIHQPSPVATSANYFSAGAVKSRITTQATVATAISSSQFPTRMKVL